MEQKISRIIEDVCAAEPSLHEREDELRQIVRAILEAQPDTKFDEAFASRVRKQVLSEAAKAKPKKPSFFASLAPADRSKFFVLGTAAFGLVLAIGLATASISGFRFGGGQPSAGIAEVPPSESFRQPLGPRTGVLALGDGAFGRLSAMPAEQGNEPGFGGGRGISPEAALSADKMLVAPDYQPVQFRYVYKGELRPAESDITVYRRKKGFDATAGAVTSVTSGVVDLSRFRDAKLQSFNMLDDRDFGYNVFVDATEGTVTFSQYWVKWPHPQSDCRDEECFRALQLKPEQMLPDEETVAIADAFLDEYGISKGPYATPEARNEYARSLALAGGDASRAYVPESVPVVYPLLIGGLKVHDQSGEPSGMLVGVSMRHKKVDNAWGIAAASYESSSYAGETDPAKLLAYLENGGPRYEIPGATIIDVPVGEPTPVLVRMWNYRQDGSSDELYVPALRFPVLEAPKDQPWAPTAVVVPLAKEMLEAQGPVAMPLEKAVER